ncbi:MAG: hypothetical protein M8865_12780 [marine benthic group bacterium]|nr:hypothetical protein [Gemmatimonadota bacterium]
MSRQFSIAAGYACAAIVVDSPTNFDSGLSGTYESYLEKRVDSPIDYAFEDGLIAAAQRGD